MIKLNESNFDSEVKSGVVLVKFGATWCGPCRMMDAILESVAKKYENDDNVKICSVDVDENPKIAKTFNITSVPSVILAKDGQMGDKFVGVKPETAIVEALEILKG